MHSMRTVQAGRVCTMQCIVFVATACSDIYKRVKSKCTAIYQLAIVKQKVLFQ